MVPSDNLPPGPYPPQAPGYTRANVQALLRMRDLEERGILVYIGEAAHALKRWWGFTEIETYDEERDEEEGGGAQLMAQDQSFLHRLVLFVLRFAKAGSRY